MSREPVDRYCMQCRKPMRRAERIEMGWSVMTGRTAVCSDECRRVWNEGRGRSGLRYTSEREAYAAAKEKP